MKRQNTDRCSRQRRTRPRVHISRREFGAQRPTDHCQRETASAGERGTIGNPGSVPSTRVSADALLDGAGAPLALLHQPVEGIAVAMRAAASRV